jgi:hypothetical protein
MPRKKPTPAGSKKLSHSARNQERAPAGPPAQSRGTQSAAIALALDAVPKGEGGRFVIGGASGKGKTWFTVKFIHEMQRRRICTTAIIHDVKDPERPQYEGKIVHSVHDAQRILVEDPPDFLICRPGISGDEAAGLVRDAAEAGEHFAFLGDELTPLLRVNQDTLEPTPRVFCGSALVWLQLQGRGPGASSIILLQLPSHMPGSALDNATAYIFFGLGGRSLDYSLDLRLVPKQAADLLTKMERGQCIVCFSDRPWDGIIYGPQ